MSGNTYLWTGAVNDDWQTPANWFDVTTNATATAAPGALDTVEINKNASIASGSVTVADMEIESNANVTLLGLPGGSEYRMTTLNLWSGATLTLGGGTTMAVAKQAYVPPGAVLDVSGGWYIGVSTHDPDARRDARSSDPGWRGAVTATFGQLELVPGYQQQGGQILIGSRNIGVGSLGPASGSGVVGTGVVGTGKVIYNTNVLEWTAANPPSPNPGNANTVAVFSTPANWLDLTTGKPATQEPGIRNTLVFTAGPHVVTGATGPAVGKVILQSKAQVDFAFQFPPVPTGSNYTFDTLIMHRDATLTVGALQSDKVILQSGATLTLDGPNNGPAPNSSAIGELINQGGTLSLGSNPANILLGLVPISSASLAMGEHPEFVQRSNAEYPSTAVGGVLGGESVIPFTNGLEIKLGDIKQGSAVQALNIAAFDAPGDTTAFTDQIAGMVGSGFVPTMSAGGVGTVAVNTATLGTHAMLVMLDSTYKTASGATAHGVPQVLVLTDHIV